MRKLKQRQRYRQKWKKSRAKRKCSIIRRTAVAHFLPDDIGRGSASKRDELNSTSDSAREKYSPHQHSLPPPGDDPLSDRPESPPGMQTRAGRTSGRISRVTPPIIQWRPMKEVKNPQIKQNKTTALLPDAIGRGSSSKRDEFDSIYKSARENYSPHQLLPTPPEDVIDLCDGPESPTGMQTRAGGTSGRISRVTPPVVKQRPVKEAKKRQIQQKKKTHFPPVAIGRGSASKRDEFDSTIESARENYSPHQFSPTSPEDDPLCDRPESLADIQTRAPVLPDAIGRGSSSKRNKFDSSYEPARKKYSPHQFSPTPPEDDLLCDRPESLADIPNCAGGNSGRISRVIPSIVLQRPVKEAKKPQIKQKKKAHFLPVAIERSSASKRDGSDSTSEPAREKYSPHQFSTTPPESNPLSDRPESLADIRTRTPFLTDANGRGSASERDEFDSTFESAKEKCSPHQFSPTPTEDDPLCDRPESLADIPNCAGGDSERISRVIPSIVLRRPVMEAKKQQVKQKKRAHFLPVAVGKSSASKRDESDSTSEPAREKYSPHQFSTTPPESNPLCDRPESLADIRTRTPFLTDANGRGSASERDEFDSTFESAKEKCCPHQFSPTPTEDDPLCDRPESLADIPNCAGGDSERISRVIPSIVLRRPVMEAKKQQVKQKKRAHFLPVAVGRSSASKRDESDSTSEPAREKYSPHQFSTTPPESNPLCDRPESLADIRTRTPFLTDANGRGSASERDEFDSTFESAKEKCSPHQFSPTPTEDDPLCDRPESLADIPNCAGGDSERISRVIPSIVLRRPVMEAKKQQVKQKKRAHFLPVAVGRSSASKRDESDSPSEPAREKYSPHQFSLTPPENNPLCDRPESLADIPNCAGGNSGRISRVIPSIVLQRPVREAKKPQIKQKKKAHFLPVAIERRSASKRDSTSEPAREKYSPHQFSLTPPENNPLCDSPESLADIRTRAPFLPDAIGRGSALERDEFDSTYEPARKKYSPHQFSPNPPEDDPLCDRPESLADIPNCAGGNSGRISRVIPSIVLQRPVKEAKKSQIKQKKKAHLLPVAIERGCASKKDESDSTSEPAREKYSPHQFSPTPPENNPLCDRPESLADIRTRAPFLPDANGRGSATERDEFDSTFESAREKYSPHQFSPTPTEDDPLCDRPESLAVIQTSAHFLSDAIGRGSSSKRDEFDSTYEPASKKYSRHQLSLTPPEDDPLCDRPESPADIHTTCGGGNSERFSGVTTSIRQQRPVKEVKKRQTMQKKKVPFVPDAIERDSASKRDEFDSTYVSASKKYSPHQPSPEDDPLCDRPESPADIHTTCGVGNSERFSRVTTSILQRRPVKEVKKRQTMQKKKVPLLPDYIERDSASKRDEFDSTYESTSKKYSPHQPSLTPPEDDPLCDRPESLADIHTTCGGGNSERFSRVTTSVLQRRPVKEVKKRQTMQKKKVPLLPDYIERDSASKRDEFDSTYESTSKKYSPHQPSLTPPEDDPLCDRPESLADIHTTCGGGNSERFSRFTTSILQRRPVKEVEKRQTMQKKKVPLLPDAIERDSASKRDEFDSTYESASKKYSPHQPSLTPPEDDPLCDRPESPADIHTTCGGGTSGRISRFTTSILQRRPAKVVIKRQTMQKKKVPFLPDVIERDSASKRDAFDSTSESAREKYSPQHSPTSFEDDPLCDRPASPSDIHTCAGGNSGRISRVTPSVFQRRPMKEVKKWQTKQKKKALILPDAIEKDSALKIDKFDSTYESASEKYSSYQLSLTPPEDDRPDSSTDIHTTSILQRRPVKEVKKRQTMQKNKVPFLPDAIGRDSASKRDEFDSIYEYAREKYSPHQFSPTPPGDDPLCDKPESPADIHTCGGWNSGRMSRIKPSIFQRRPMKEVKKWQTKQKKKAPFLPDAIERDSASERDEFDSSYKSVSKKYCPHQPSLTPPEDDPLCDRPASPADIHTTCGGGTSGRISRFTTSILQRRPAKVVIKRQTMQKKKVPFLPDVIERDSASKRDAFDSTSESAREKYSPHQFSPTLPGDVPLGDRPEYSEIQTRAPFLSDAIKKDSASKREKYCPHHLSLTPPEDEPLRDRPESPSAIHTCAGRTSGRISRGTPSIPRRRPVKEVKRPQMKHNRKADMQPRVMSMNEVGESGPPFTKPVSPQPCFETPQEGMKKDLIRPTFPECEPFRPRTVSVTRCPVLDGGSPMKKQNQEVAEMRPMLPSMTEAKMQKLGELPCVPNRVNNLAVEGSQKLKYVKQHPLVFKKTAYSTVTATDLEGICKIDAVGTRTTTIRKYCRKGWPYKITRTGSDFAGNVSVSGRKESYIVTERTNFVSERQITKNLPSIIKHKRANVRVPKTHLPGEAWSSYGQSFKPNSSDTYDLSGIIAPLSTPDPDPVRRAAIRSYAPGNYRRGRGPLNPNIVKVGNAVSKCGNQNERETAPYQPPPEIARLDVLLRKRLNLPNGQVSYNLRKNGRPPFSYQTMAAMAIEGDPLMAAEASDILNFIKKHFPFYQKITSKYWKHTVLTQIATSKFLRSDRIGCHVYYSFCKELRLPGDPAICEMTDEPSEKIDQPEENEGIQQDHHREEHDVVNGQNDNSPEFIDRYPFGGLFTPQVGLQEPSELDPLVPTCSYSDDETDDFSVDTGGQLPPYTEPEEDDQYECDTKIEEEPDEGIYCEDSSPDMESTSLSTNGERVYACPYCPTVSDTIQDNLDHSIIHPEVTKPCPQCDFSTPDEVQLLWHVNSGHSKHSDQDVELGSVN